MRSRSCLSMSKMRHQSKASRRNWAVDDFLHFLSSGWFYWHRDNFTETKWNCSAYELCVFMYVVFVFYVIWIWGLFVIYVVTLRLHRGVLLIFFFFSVSCSCLSAFLLFSFILFHRIVTCGMFEMKCKTTRLRQKSLAPKVSRLLRALPYHSVLYTWTNSSRKWRENLD